LEIHGKTIKKGEGPARLGWDPVKGGMGMGPGDGPQVD